MTNQEWESREQFYIAKTKIIRTMDNMEVGDIKRVVAQLDELVNEAYFDLSLAQADLSQQKAILDTMTSELFIAGKNTVEEGAKNGMSDEKAKSFSRLEADKMGLIGKKIDAERRCGFMENVIKLVESKKSLLMISYGLFKIERGIPA